jgi:hypothetical protein
VNWGGVIATGPGSSGITTITFTAQAARYIRILQTGSAPGTFWSIHEFNVFGTAPTAPSGLAATPASGQVNLSWPASVSATGYNVKRAALSGGAYAMIATNVSGLNYSDTGLANGTVYYYVVTATNGFGESVSSPEAGARPVSVLPPPLTISSGSGQLQLAWPADHLGWRLEAQTNSPGAGLGTNWVVIPNSAGTNIFFVPIGAGDRSVFFRLVYP